MVFSLYYNTFWFVKKITQIINNKNILIDELGFLENIIINKNEPDLGSDIEGYKHMIIIKDDTKEHNIILNSVLIIYKKISDNLQINIKMKF